MNTESCDARKVEPHQIERPGDFYFDAEQADGKRMFHTRLPGDGCLIAIPVKRGPAPDGPCWGWDGNENKPTLTPSIHTHGHWHGFLRAGRFESC